MKKTFVVLFAILIVVFASGGVVADQLDQATMEAKKHAGEPQARPTLQLLPGTQTSLNLDETIIYETTFENADDWTVVDEGTTTDTWQLLSEVNQFGDIPMVANAPFMWVDSDDAGSGNVHLIETLISPLFDAGTYTHVYMIADIHYNWIGEDYLSMNISVDGGETWTEFANLAEDFYAYPAVYDISEYVTGESECQISFIYDDGGVWAWYCGIDNVRILGNDGPFDMLPPTVEITQGPVTGFQNMPDGREIVAVATDDVGIDQMALEYGLVENMTVEEVLTIDMVATENPNEWSAWVPTEFGVAGDSIAYAVVAYDAAGNSARSPYGEGVFNYFKLFGSESSVQFIERDYEFIDISTTGTIISDSDDVTEQLVFADLGFASFDWYNFSYYEISICSNGWMAFGHETSTSFSVSIPNTNSPNGIFALCADDLNPNAAGSGKIYYQMVDGNLVIQYGSPAAPIYFYSDTFGPVFQVVMDPVDNTLTVNYHTIAGFMDGENVYTGNHVIGSEGPDGLIASILYQGIDYVLPANETSYMVASFLGHIEGIVIDADSAPLANCEVKLLNSEGETIRLVHSDDTGAYLLDYVIPEVYSIRVLKPGYVPVTIDNITVEGLETITQDFTLESDPNVTTFAGNVWDLDGASADTPAEGIEVYLIQMDMTSTTDATGAYSFGDVPLYDFTVEVNVGLTNPDYHDLTFEITTVLNNEPVDIDLNQILAPTNLVVDAAFGAAKLMFDAPANEMAPPALMDAISQLSYLVDMHYNHNKVVENIEEVEANLATYQNIYANITSELGLDEITDFAGYRVKQDGTLLDDIFESETFTITGLTNRITYAFEVAADYGYDETFLMFSESVSGTPMSVPYTYDANTYEWVEIRTNDLGTAIPYAGSDDYSGMIEMGMSFNFYNVDYSSMNITNNGFISFTEQAAAGTFAQYNEAPIPTEDAPNGMVAVNWDDMHHDADDSTHTAYYYYDEATNSFIVTWFFNRFETDNLLEYQGIFYGDSGEMVFNYKSSSLGWEGATIGVESQDGTYGTGYDQPNAADEMSLRFVPPVMIFGSVDGMVTDGAGNGLVDVEVYLDTGFFLGMTANDGSYDFVCPIGTYDILFDHPDFYQGTASAIVIAEAAATTVPTVILAVPHGVVSPTSLSITYDLEELIADPDYTVSDVVTLSNIGDCPLEFSTSIRMTPTASDFFSQARHRAFRADGSSVAESFAGPVVQELSLDDVWEPWDDGQTWPVTGASVGALVTDEHVMTVLWSAPYTYYVWDLDGNVVLEENLPEALMGTRDFEWDGEFVYTAISGTGDVFKFPPLAPADYELVVNSASVLGRGLAYDVDNGHFYLSDWGENLGVDMLFNNGDGTYTLVPLVIPANAVSIYGIAYMPNDPDDMNLWLFCQLGAGDGTVIRVDPVTGVGDDGYQVYTEDQGIAGGIEISASYNPNMYTVATCMQTFQIDLWEGYSGAPSTMTVTIDPTEGSIQPDGSVDLNVTVACTPDQPNGVFFAMMRISGEYYDMIEVPIEITVVGTITDVVESALPVEYALHQNYPNPFNPTTAIRFDLKAAQTVNLVVFNMLGQEVAQLVDSRMTAGFHSVNFNASQLSTGVYFYRIKTEAFTSMKKMVLIK
jgi:Carboxypeptidase regulatory-like domain/Secretion system C-terminal sorting domain